MQEMGIITVAVELEHLTTAQLPMMLMPTSDQSRIILIPNLSHDACIRSSLKSFLFQHLFIPEEMQLLVAPLFTKLGEKDTVEELYNHYICQAEVEASDLYMDEDSFTFFGRESGKTVDLADNARLDEYNVLDRATLQLKRIPQQLPETGGRVFVETKDGILPLLGISPPLQVADLKKTLEKLTGIPPSQQMLSSIGQVMHDQFQLKDFEGLHRIYEDSVIDLCKSGDCNFYQAHKRMAVSVSVVGESEFELIVQGRDTVQAFMEIIESRTGIAPWQQRITFSGKILQEKKPLGEYFIYPGCVLQVTLFRSPLKTPRAGTPCSLPESKGVSGDGSVRKPAARKIKLFRTNSGHITGTLTIPVLTTDTVSDLRRKIKRSLRPLTERNFIICSPVKDQNHIDITPKSCSPSSPIRTKGKSQENSSLLQSPAKSPLSQLPKPPSVLQYLKPQASSAESRMLQSSSICDPPPTASQRSCVRELSSKFGTCSVEIAQSTSTQESVRIPPSEISIQSEKLTTNDMLEASFSSYLHHSQGEAIEKEWNDNSKKGLTAWLSEGMQSLKLMKVPFVESNLKS